MNSRENMLAAIRQNKPAPGVDAPDWQPLPTRVTFGEVPTDLVTPFKTVLQAIGATVVEAAGYADVRIHLRANFPDVSNVAVTVPELGDLADFSLAIRDPHELELINLAILPGQWGVAENGAIWLTEQEMVHRALPFITQHLVLVVHREDLVATMHQAYDRIQVDETGFGVFIAGPSKTADIEQSLVIGAHGARSLIVYILG